MTSGCKETRRIQFVKDSVNRRDFLGLVIGTACATTPAILFADTATTTDDKLDQFCSGVGQFVRDRNIRPSRVIAIGETGRLVIEARIDMETDSVFHIADRKLNYTRLGYRVEDRFLDRANGVSVYVNGCRSFPLVFR